MRQAILMRTAYALARLVPSEDREPIIGDLLEEAAGRNIAGLRLTWWMLVQCGAIAAGLAIERARAAVGMTQIREVASGLAVESGHALRGFRDTPRVALARVAVFALSTLALTLGVQVLVAALLSAAGFRF